MKGCNKKCTDDFVYIEKDYLVVFLLTYLLQLFYHIIFFNHIFSKCLFRKLLKKITLMELFLQFEQFSVCCFCLYFSYVYIHTSKFCLSFDLTYRFGSQICQNQSCCITIHLPWQFESYIIPIYISYTNNHIFTNSFTYCFI